MTILAYCFFDEEVGLWDNYCPDCFALFQSADPELEADAEVLGLNGDSMPCAGCGKEIK